MAERVINTDRVRVELLERGTPRWKLTKVLGNLERRQINRALRNIKDTGVEIPTPELVPTEPEIVTRFRAGEQSAIIKPYGDMGMTAREVQIALQIDKEIILTTSQAREAINKGRKRGKIRQLTAEEQEDSARNSHMTPEELQDNVKVWLGAVAIANIHQIDTRTWNRLDWKKFTQEYEEEARVMVKIRQDQAENKKERGYLLKIRGASEETISLLYSNEETNTGESESLDNLNAIKFAKQLIAKGFITEDLSVWEMTKQIAERAGKPQWFDRFHFALIMEAYVKARVDEVKGKRDAMRQYVNIGKAIDVAWFESDLMARERSAAKYKVY